MELERKASGVAKGGLTTGIIGTSLGALALMGQGGSILGNLGGNASRTVVVDPAAVTGCHCNEQILVNRYEMELNQRLAEKDSQIALRDANAYNDQKMLEMYKYIDGRFREFESAFAAQEVKNQRTDDSVLMVNERINCCCKELQNDICNEKRERQCADNTIVTYVNGTFYPKQVADVTVGTTSTAQAVYNPLPIQISGNGSCCCNN